MGEISLKSLRMGPKDPSTTLREILALADPKTLTLIITAEQVQTAALIVAHLEAPKAAQVLAALPSSQRTELVLRLSRLGSIASEIVEDLAAVLGPRIVEIENRRSKPLGGIDKVASLLTTLGASEVERVLDEMGGRDHQLSEQIKGALFRFEDLARLDDRAAQTFLAHAPKGDLKLALLEPSPVKTLLMRNLSPRAQVLMNDEIAVMPKTLKTDVDKARQRLVALALKLEGEGKMTIPKPGETYV